MKTGERVATIQLTVLAALMHVKPDYRSPQRLDECAATIARFVEAQAMIEEDRLRLQIQMLRKIIADRDAEVERLQAALDGIDQWSMTHEDARQRARRAKP